MASSPHDTSAGRLDARPPHSRRAAMPAAGTDISGCEPCSGVVTGLALLRAWTDARLPR